MPLQEREAVIADFKTERDGFLHRLLELASPRVTGKSFEDIQKDLRRLANSLSMWSLVWEPVHEKDPAYLPCCQFKCAALAGAVREITNKLVFENKDSWDLSKGAELTEPVRLAFYMLYLQVGRLTLDGYTDDDKKAERFALAAECHDKLCIRTPVNANANANSDAEYLAGLWQRLHIKLEDCSCCQCLNYYVMTSEERAQAGLEFPWEVVSDDSGSE